MERRSVAPGGTFQPVAGLRILQLSVLGGTDISQALLCEASPRVAAGCSSWPPLVLAESWLFQRHRFSSQALLDRLSKKEEGCGDDGLRRRLGTLLSLNHRSEIVRLFGGCVRRAPRSVGGTRRLPFKLRFSKRPPERTEHISSSGSGQKIRLHHFSSHHLEVARIRI